MPALCGLEGFLVEEPDEEVQGIANATEGDNENIKLTKRVKLLQFATRKEKWLLTAAAIGNIYNGAAYSLIMSLVIYCAQAKMNGENWTIYIVGMVGAVVLDFAAGFVAAALAELAAERQLRKLKLAFLDHLMNQEMGYFDKFDAVSLAVRLNYQADVIRRSTGQKFAQIWLYGGLIGACIFRMFQADAKLAGLSLVLLPLIIITGWWAAHVDNQADRISQNAFASAASIAREALSNVKTVKSFALEGMMTQRFRAAANKAERSTTRAGVLAGIALGLHNGMIYCTFGFALWYGVKVIADAKESNTTKTFDEISLVSVFGSILMIAFGMSKIFPTLITISKAKYAIRQVLQVYARESKINPSDGGGSIIKLKGDIRFDNVAFKYNPDADRHVFQSLNLHIPAGKSVALVGASGSGKSTIIQLIERFYDVTGGQITVDGVPIESINLLNLRSQIALVSQEPRLFSDTIAANIGCGREGSSRDEIIDAAKKANAHDFIMQFPDGYDTWVGESGGQLSGGQKQRIAIARALIRDPQILILDEATSALDNESEKIVQETINEVVKDSQRTTIIIAHRLTTVRSADKIVVLDNPKGDGAVVAEEGTHDELLGIENGLYAALVASQLGKEAADGASPADAVDWSIRMSSQLATSFSRDLAPSRQSSLLRLHSKFAQSKDTIASKNEIQGGWRLLTSADPEQHKGLRVKPRVYRRTARVIRDQWPSTVIGIIATCVSGFAWPVIGFALARSIACFFYEDYNEQRREAKKYMLFYIILGIVSLFSIALSRAFGDRVAAILVKRLRTSVFETFLKKTASFFDDPNNSSGMLVSILSLDLARLGNWGGANLAAYFTTIAVFLAAAIVSLNAYWKLGLVTLAGSCLLAPISWINSQLVSTGRLELGRHQVGRKRQLEVIDGVVMSRSDAIMTEAILNIRAITAFNLQESMSTRYKEAVNRDYAIGKRGAWFTGLSWGTSQCLILGIVVGCIYYAFWLMDNDVADPWSMVQAILVLLFAAFNIGRAFSALSDDSKARESAAKVYALTDQPKPFDEYSENGSYIDHIDDIQFNRVAFRYIRRPDLPIYRDVTFRIPKGQVTALVGGSGCGKSTAIQLIQHLYMIGEGFEYSDEMGDITVNGIKMSELNIQALRSCIGIVSQEPALFWGTIEDNISYGCPGCTAEDIKAAAMAANAWDFIQKLPDGMQTDVGRGGAKLSGGQKQRIAIARALVRKPKLLILDEATSALDAESERVVQETLDRLLATRQFTTVMIAHRLSTVRKADQIVVFLNADQRGSKVAEIGTHEELMKIKNGAYRGLVRIAENK